MMEQYDLDEVAQALFSVRTPDKPEYERLLIRAGASAVKPLLKAVVFVTSRQKDKTKDLARHGKRSTIGEIEARYMWAKVTLEPVIDDSLKIIQVIGASATDELCRFILDPDKKIRLGAALILCKGGFTTGEVREAVQSAIYQIGPDKKQGAHILLLGVIMANNGDNLWQGVIHDFAQKEGITIERWVEKTINTGLIELQRYK